MNLQTKVIVGVIDGTTGVISSANVAVLGTNTVAGSYLYNCQLTSGLRIVTKANPANFKPSITVIWRR